MKIWKYGIAALFVMSSAVPLMAIPAGFNIQGRLTDANGINKDGTFQIKFAVYTADVGGTLVWDKNMPSVTVKNGNFQIILQGQGDTGGQLEAAVKDLEAAYVEIKVGADPALVPRQPLLRSPFSASDRVSGAVDVLIQSDSQASGSGLIAMRTGNTDRVTILNNGNVGIGTNSPAEKLSVAGNVSIAGAISADNLVGAVMFFAGLSCPAGWLPLDGSTLSVSGVYNPLFNRIAYLYGGSDLSFVLPNMTDGPFIRASGGNALAVGKKQPDAFKSHTHTIPRRYGTNYGNDTSAMGSSIWAPIATIATNPEGSSETRPINYAMTACIKY